MQHEFDESKITDPKSLIEAIAMEIYGTGFSSRMTDYSLSVLAVREILQKYKTMWWYNPNQSIPITSDQETLRKIWGNIEVGLQETQHKLGQVLKSCGYKRPPLTHFFPNLTPKDDSKGWWNKWLPWK
jgi:hypothetical protein